MAGSFLPNQSLRHECRVPTKFYTDFMRSTVLKDIHPEPKLSA